MKKFLLYSTPYLFITSILISQPDENSCDKYIPDLHLPDSNLQKLIKQTDKPDSCIYGNILKNGILVLPDQHIKDLPKNSFENIPNRNDNMPVYSFEGEYYPKMPEYHADPNVTYIMPELKYPGLIRNKSKVLKGLKKHNWGSSLSR